MVALPETNTTGAPPPVPPIVPPLKPVGFLKSLGPGLVTGAADDDPSGIATYSQVGAQFGYGLAWTMLFSFPLKGSNRTPTAWGRHSVPASGLDYTFHDRATRMAKLIHNFAQA